VGYDGSPAATRALDAADRLIQGRQGLITVVWVAHLGAAVSMSADATVMVESGFDQVAQALRSTAGERLGDGPEQWEFKWRQGPIAHELIAEAKSIQASHPDDVVALVVGSSSSTMHRMAGSIAVELAHHSPVSLIIVP
jgi:nucleotide-binding universal stress UspA family protein